MPNAETAQMTETLAGTLAQVAKVLSRLRINVPTPSAPSMDVRETAMAMRRATLHLGQSDAAPVAGYIAGAAVSAWLSAADMLALYATGGAYADRRIAFSLHITDAEDYARRALRNMR